jgi:hypothetical protein
MRQLDMAKIGNEFLWFAGNLLLAWLCRCKL